MNKVHSSEWLEIIENGNNNILYFQKGITTEEGLAKIKKHRFKCGYHYTIKVNGTTIKRALFYNHKNDLLSLRYSDDRFYLRNESSRLYIYRLVPFGENEQKLKAMLPINPFTEHLLTKSAIPEGALPIELEEFKQVFQHERYLFPENKKTEIYKRAQEKNSDRLESVLRLANRYLFAETYNEFDEHLKEIYKPLLDMHMELFYEELADVLEHENGEDVVIELLNMLNITLDYDYLSSKINEKGQITFQPYSISKEILLDFLKSYRKKITKRINPLATINKHAEWFTREQTLENTKQIIMAKVAV